MARDRDAVLDLFEEVFQHRSYTGRSGVMYGYEGLGCIYWHMVAKLLLAVQEIVLRDDIPAELRHRLADMYFRVRAGIGYQKSATEYGSFPTDPYSHTPPDGGAKQPGMTGQVKEEILTRRGELGIRVDDGGLEFRPELLKAGEFLYYDAYYDGSGAGRPLEIRHFDAVEVGKGTTSGTRSTFIDTTGAFKCPLQANILRPGIKVNRRGGRQIEFILHGLSRMRNDVIDDGIELK